jgi:hypothetical protein
MKTDAEPSNFENHIEPSIVTPTLAPTKLVRKKKVGKSP